MHALYYRGSSNNQSVNHITDVKLYLQTNSSKKYHFIQWSGERMSLFLTGSRSYLNFGEFLHIK